MNQKCKYYYGIVEEIGVGVTDDGYTIMAEDLVGEICELTETTEECEKCDKYEERVTIVYECNLPF